MVSISVMKGYQKLSRFARYSMHSDELRTCLAFFDRREDCKDRCFAPVSYLYTQVSSSVMILNMKYVKFLLLLGLILGD